ncbi:MAG: nucleoside 2-deoxyribosyltransferase [Deltaproteobacteria bacterium]|nr:nucleoside 2-deoxyribosyltransferase [Deltaproteobacteria bacterium]
MQPLSIYFAGSLFCHKDLVGNLHLAHSIENESKKSLRCVLPQNLESVVTRALDVRNQDLLQVINCDLALFNFDGTDLDSGTIVEFMMAKMLDVPAVVLRTDFRWSGDQNKDGDPWNLMCSGYPRSRVILKNGMAEYQAAQRKHQDKHPVHTVEELHDSWAKEIVSAFSELRRMPSLFDGDQKQALAIYEWAIKFPGGGLSVPSGWCKELVSRKAAAGLI